MFFTLKKQKSLSVLGFYPETPNNFVSHVHGLFWECTAMFLNEFIKLCCQIDFLYLKI